MQKMKIGMAAAAVFAVVLMTCMALPAPAEEGPALGDPGQTPLDEFVEVYLAAIRYDPSDYTESSYAVLEQAIDDAWNVLIDPYATDDDYIEATQDLLAAIAQLQLRNKNTVGTAAELIGAILAGQKLIVLTNNIELTGGTVLTIPAGKDVTIESDEGSTYAITFKGNTQLAVLGALTLRNVNMVQSAEHYADPSNPWFRIGGNAELYVYDCVIRTDAALAGARGLITSTSGSTTAYFENSALISNQRAIYSQYPGAVYYLRDTSVSSMVQALCGGDFILYGSTTYISNSSDSYIFDFRSVSVAGPIYPVGNVQLTKTGTGVATFLPGYKIYYRTGVGDFGLGTVNEYTSAIPITDDITLYAAVGYVQGSRAYFSDPVEINCVYDVMLDTYYDVVLPNAPGFTLTPYGSSSSPVRYGDDFWFTLELDRAYDRSAPIVKANGYGVFFFEGIYRLIVGADVFVTVDGVSMNVYDVHLPSGAGYTVTPVGHAPAMEHGSSFTFTISVASGFDATSMAVTVNGVALYPIDGVYTVFVDDDIVIAVNGVNMSLFYITLTPGEGYTLIGSTVVGYGSTYMFAIQIDPGYADRTYFVKVNGNTVSPVFPAIYMGIATEDIVVTVEWVMKITLTPGTGYTLYGDATALKGTTYQFTLALAPGYDKSSPTVKANGVPVTPSGGVYGVYVNADLVITVEGVVLNPYGVTLTPGTGYTLNGVSTVTHGGTYSFTVTVVGGYNAATLVVKVNGAVVTAVGGTYTITNVTGDLVITATIDHNGNSNGNNGNRNATPSSNNGGTNNGNPNGNNGNGNGNNKLP